MTALSRSGTVLDALVAAIENTSAHNRQDQVPPAAVLWTDQERQWEALLPQLKERLPIFVLGKYSPDEHIGPAYWLRCIIAGTIPHPGLLPEKVPVLYLPGYSRQDLRALDTCPVELQPLAELRYRGVLWSQRNGRDWTVSAFLQSKDGGLAIAVEGDNATKEALQRALPKLAEESIDALLQAAPLRAAYLDGLIHPNSVKDVLRWLNDPEGYQGECSEQEWAAFVALCADHYDFRPDREGPVAAAEKLGRRNGNWGRVWGRFAETPASYSVIPERLREAKPQMAFLPIDHTESWPQDNEVAEASLRSDLLQLSSLDSDAARRRVLELEIEHGERRNWVWSSLGSAPLAQAMKHLAAVARVSEHRAWGTSLAEIVDNYARTGWEVDLAVLDALASVEGMDDARAVRSAVRMVYRPWLECVVEAFQTAVNTADLGDYKATAPPQVSDRTCLLFVDGLRFDLAQRLATMLGQRGIENEVEPHLTALPSVTATAKPAVSPAADALMGDDDFDTAVKASGSKVNAHILRREIAEVGFEILREEGLGGTVGRAWSEFGEIDRYGHNHGWRVAHHAIDELRRLSERIAGFLDHGWQKVVVVTDHGWLMMPDGLPKADLPEHLTEIRKGRCARLKEGSQTDQQVVAWHWDHTVRIAMAPGIHCYQAGKEYEHGGLSPQECVVPVLTATGRAAHAAVSIGSVRWHRLRCDITIEGATAAVRVDIRTRGSDPTTTLAAGGQEIGSGYEASLSVEDPARAGDAAVVVLVAPDGTVLSQTSTIVGDA